MLIGLVLLALLVTIVVLATLAWAYSWGVRLALGEAPAAVHWLALLLPPMAGAAWCAVRASRHTRGSDVQGIWIAATSVLVIFTVGVGTWGLIYS